MAGELTITVVGNLANDPEIRHVAGGIAVVNLNVASTPRTYNKETNTWVDGDTVWVKCTAWRELAENIGQSLTKGTRLIVTGRLNNFDGILNRRLIHIDLLEPAHEGAVLFEVLTELLIGRRAHAA